ncbi:MAG: DUF4845 domain-containing protein [Nitrosomonadales bacterium]|nr:DUF4845 domain-containing protein [Nitrosomonadales bacterium]
MKTMANRQRGISFSGFMMTVIVLILAVILGMRLIPAYIENASIKSAFVSVAHDPELQKARDSDILLAYSKRAQVSNISAIKADDIDIGREGGGLSLSATYSVKVPLFANISLLLDFNPGSDAK